ncbi:MAG: lytic transglycosylase domain-containing protein [bacterium]
MRKGRWVWLWMAALLLLSAPAAATIYCYVDENGVRHYTDKPNSTNYKRLYLWGSEARKPAPAPHRPDFSDIINQACAHYRVDPAMVKAMIRVESNFNPKAVSKKGAMGLMQLMPGTARQLGVSDPFNPVENIWAGTYYIKCQIVRFKYKYDLAFAAYNAGPNAVERYNGIPPYPETRRYVKKVNYYWKHYRRHKPR